MDVKIEPSWKTQLQEEFNKDYFHQLTSFVKQEFSQNKVYPPGKAIFRAFDCCRYEDVKVVIIGQDPYHGPGQADGLAFSVQEGVKMPPSLLNIFKEIKDELNKELPPNGNLERWAKQGVLLLNATLTVRARQAGSHQNQGWEQFTDNVIRKLSTNKEGLVFLLWGAYAQRKEALIDNNKHLVLKSPHPSPFSADRGFFGNGHFKKANEYLAQQGKTPIDW